jgi:hypothetical protein
MWPDWLTEARAALIISSASAIFAGMSGVYSRRLAKNDSLKMQRKSPIIELEDRGAGNTLDGWQEWSLIIRNQEAVSVILHEVTAIKKGGFILTERTAYNDQGNGLGGRALKIPLPELKTSALDYRVSPFSTASRSGGYARDTVYCYCLTKNVQGVSDIKVRWSWADGQKR